MLLDVQNLKTHFKVGFDKTAKAVDGVSFQLEQGKTVALVGESGCGKTQTAYSIIRLLAENGTNPSGKVLYQGKDLLQFSEESMRQLRGNDIAMIFQEPMSSLNPLYRIGNQLEEPLRLHRKVNQGSARTRCIELLDRVGIPEPQKRIDDFPHQLSGGMKQRVMIAMALACEPKLLIADEPTTALDVTIQAQVLHLMSELQQQTGMGILLITHDMGIVNQMADSICIMYAGKIAEQGPREKVYQNMFHPYTRRLFDSIPKPGDTPYLLNTIPGMVPPATEYGEGCLFANRCEFVMDICTKKESAVYSMEPKHQVTCHLFDQGKNPALDHDRERHPAPPRNIEPTEILSVQSLKTHFPVRKGVFRRVAEYVKAVDDVSLNFKRGSTLALVGESGCGKTTFGESLLRLNRNTKGTVMFHDKDIMKLKTPELKLIRKHLQIVFQDPYGSLSPRMTVENIIGEGLEIHFAEQSAEEKSKRIADVLGEVGLAESVRERYPHEFSGGQRQRIAIARALVLEPEFLVLDEPTSALDVSVQAQVLNLLKELQSKHSLTYLFISHNLSVVRYMADTVAIMYLGRIVEQAPVTELFKNPRHPYTRSLLDAVPSLEERKPFNPLVGDVPSPRNPPAGCHFHQRCPIYLNEPEGSPLAQKCRSEYPKKTGTETDFVACHAAGYPIPGKL
ncbi:MAG: dipeptide ABC transporter ATP-binding protein [Nitrospinae bacterium]|jgi:peptide/nickel transport system ATP-binding protein|nr:dipeptide ABC transporter ATP-binding protein [Nitrospinota bacterium]MDA1110554.1 dipeptide ABC transporter ATP-binding protein [Nitrospinota bacterium]